MIFAVSRGKECRYLDFSVFSVAGTSSTRRTVIPSEARNLLLVSAVKNSRFLGLITNIGPRNDGRGDFFSSLLQGGFPTTFSCSG